MNRRGSTCVLRPGPGPQGHMYVHTHALPHVCSTALYPGGEAPYMEPLLLLPLFPLHPTL